jgi:hypothetical protein
VLEDPNAGGIGSVLNMQLVKVLEGPNNGDGGSLLNLQLVFFLECFFFLIKLGVGEEHVILPSQTTMNGAR